jgi:hypothetical protein
VPRHDDEPCAGCRRRVTKSRRDNPCDTAPG